MRTYEVMTIHRPELDENDFHSRVDGVVSYLTDRGATITGKDIWGKRRFAYEINHMNEGYYSVVTFSASPEAIAELDRMQLEVREYLWSHPAEGSGLALAG